MIYTKCICKANEKDTRCPQHGIRRDEYLNPVDVESITINELRQEIVKLEIGHKELYRDFEVKLKIKDGIIDTLKDIIILVCDH